MPYPNLTKSKAPKGVLPLLNCGGGLGCHGPPILDTGRQACRGGLVPNPQTGLLRQPPDVFFPQPRFEQGRGHLVLTGGLLPWPIVSQVIEVDTISDSIEPAAPAIRFHRGEQLVFAVVAAGRVVAKVLRALRL